MRILIDAFQHSGFVTGTDRVAANLLREFQELDDRNEYIVLVNRDQPYIQRVLRSANFRPYPLWPTPRRHLFLPGVLAALSRRLRVDVCFSFFNLTGPLLGSRRTVVSVLDLVPFLYSREYFAKRLRSELARRLILASMNRAVRVADRFVAISEHSKVSLVERFGIDPAEVDVAHLQADPSFFAEPPPEELARVRSKYGLPERFVLTMGSSEPRKNVVRLLEAHELLPRPLREGFGLVVAGPPWPQRQLPGASCLHATGYVTDEDLPSLYRLATVFVFPSLYEGFGLPVLEAMASGTPVLSSDATSLPEVGGDAVLYFDPKDPERLSKLLAETLEDGEGRKTLSDAGRERVGSFSWRRAAETYLQAITGRRAPAC